MKQTITPNSRVNIYSDPLTCQKLEGQATLLFVHSVDSMPSGTMLARCTVLFDDGSKCDRTILADGDTDTIFTGIRADELNAAVRDPLWPLAIRLAKSICYESGPELNALRLLEILNEQKP